MNVQTNVFPITNLGDLSSKYRLYRIRGLTPQDDHYYLNRQLLISRLSWRLANPVTVVERDGTPYLVVRADGENPPSPFELVRTRVRFEALDETFSLDYTQRSPDNDLICTRFLQFAIQAPFRQKLDLWQPSSGRPFYRKEPARNFGRQVLYRGFSTRAVVTPDGGMGLCVDVANCYASAQHLPTNLSRNDLQRWLNRHCIYRYGHQWYEIKIRGVADLSAGQYEIQDGDEWLTLPQWILRDCRRPVPPELHDIRDDEAVVTYQNNRNQTRAAPTSLCYPVYGTEDRQVAAHHRETILPPHVRYRLVQEFVRDYMTDLSLGSTHLVLDRDSVSAPSSVFQVPDIEFGGGKVLSVRGTSGKEFVSLSQLGQARLNMMYDGKAGLFVRHPLYRQYCIMPQSVMDTFGPRFIEDLKHEVQRLHPQQPAYDPIPVTYDDSGPRTYPHQGKRILDAVRSQCTDAGYAVVMIHSTSDRRLRSEDQLAGMLMRELRSPETDIVASIIHVDVSRECYQLVTGDANTPEYRPATDRRKHGKLQGYLRNVAINKVLLTNHCWPFVLATPLHADITVGIDVKQNTAGLVVVGRRGERIRTLFKTSRQKEQLMADQMHAYLHEILTAEIQDAARATENIVIHRDGRTWQSEVIGAREAIAALKKDGLLPSTAQLTIVEIPKTSPVSLRLFEVTDNHRRRTWVDNPTIGRYYVPTRNEAYICNTGTPFLHQGTAKPLHVRLVEGDLPLQQCVEDIFCLACLTWTQPQGCTRYPITIKLNDRFLVEQATEYDADALDLASSLEKMEVTQ